MSNRSKTLFVAIVTWHVACLVMYFVSGHVINQFVVAAYTTWFGEIQQSFGRFARIETYLAFVVITSPASLISLRLFDGLSRRQVKWKQRLITFLGWQIVVVAVLVWSYEAGFSYMIHRLDWAIFGPQENLYSFRNLMVDRIIAWLLCTTPVAWIALRAHPKLSGIGTSTGIQRPPSGQSR